MNEENDSSFTHREKERDKDVPKKPPLPVSQSKSGNIKIPNNSNSNNLWNSISNTSSKHPKTPDVDKAQRYQLNFRNFLSKYTVHPRNFNILGTILVRINIT